MSYPTEQLHNLSLQGEPMDPQEEPSSRVQRGRGRAQGGQPRVRGTGSRGEGSEVSPEDDSAPEGSSTPRQRAQQERRRKDAQRKAAAAQMKQAAPSRPIAPRPTSSTSTSPQELRGITNIPYTSRNIREPLKSMASEVLRSPSVLYTESARQMEREGESFVSFQLKRTESVSLYEKPTRYAPAGLKCSCRTWADVGICMHIYYLYDGINDAIGELDAASDPQSLEPSAVAERFASWHKQIADQLPSLPDMLNFRVDIESDTDEEDKEQEVSELVSVLDKNQLPLEVNEKLAPGAPAFEGSLSEMITPGNPIPALWILARHDSVFLDCLRNAISPELRAKDVCFKLGVRVKNAVDQFDDYCKEGSRTSWSKLEGDTVQNIATVFRTAMAQLLGYLNNSSYEAAFFAPKAVFLALELLELAQERDKDVYSELAAHNRTLLAPSQAEYCNLFLNLFSQPSAKGTDARYLFPANLVRFLSNDAVKPHLRGNVLDRLQSLFGRLEQKYEVTDVRLRATSGTASRSPLVTRFLTETKTILTSLYEAGGSLAPSRGLRHRPSDLSESAAQRRKTDK